MTLQNDFESRFAKALSQTPELPECYDGILRIINKRKSITRLVYGIAALFIISLVSFVFVNVHSSETMQAIHSDVSDELTSIHTHLYGDDIREEILSCSLIGEEMD
jgi:hypothetical protein